MGQDQSIRSSSVAPLSSIRGRGTSAQLTQRQIQKIEQECRRKLKHFQKRFEDARKLKWGSQTKWKRERYQKLIRDIDSYLILANDQILNQDSNYREIKRLLMTSKKNLANRLVREKRFDEAIAAFREIKDSNGIRVSQRRKIESLCPTYSDMRSYKLLEAKQLFALQAAFCADNCAFSEDENYVYVSQKMLEIGSFIADKLLVDRRYEEVVDMYKRVADDKFRRKIRVKIFKAFEVEILEKLASDSPLDHLQWVKQLDASYSKELDADEHWGLNLYVRRLGMEDHLDDAISLVKTMGNPDLFSTLLTWKAERLKHHGFNLDKQLDRWSWESRKAEVESNREGVESLLTDVSLWLEQAVPIENEEGEMCIYDRGLSRALFELVQVYGHYDQEFALRILDFATRAGYHMQSYYTSVINRRANEREVWGLCDALRDASTEPLMNKALEQVAVVFRENNSDKTKFILNYIRGICFKSRELFGHRSTAIMLADMCSNVSSGLYPFVKTGIAVIISRACFPLLPADRLVVLKFMTSILKESVGVFDSRYYGEGAKETLLEALNRSFKHFAKGEGAGFLDTLEIKEAAIELLEHVSFDEKLEPLVGFLSYCKIPSDLLARYHECVKKFDEGFVSLMNQRVNLVLNMRRQAEIEKQRRWSKAKKHEIDIPKDGKYKYSIKFLFPIKVERVWCTGNAKVIEDPQVTMRDVSGKGWKSESVLNISICSFGEPGKVFVEFKADTAKMRWSYDDSLFCPETTEREDLELSVNERYEKGIRDRAEAEELRKRKRQELRAKERREEELRQEKAWQEERQREQNRPSSITSLVWTPDGHELVTEYYS